MSNFEDSGGSIPVNQDPNFIYEALAEGGNFLAAYGWFLLAAVLVLIFLWKKYQPQLNAWQDQAEAARYKKDFDADIVEQRQQAQAARLQKLQEEHDRQAAIYAAKQAELEEKKRQEKLEDWDRHQQGLGYRSKTRRQEVEESTTVIPKSKKKLRDSDYSPLTGDENPSERSSGWRNSRRGPAAGGG